MNVEEIKIKGLTRGDLRRIQDAGVDVRTMLDDDDPNVREGFLDIVLPLGVADTGVDLDALTPHQRLRLWVRISRLAFLGAERAPLSPPQPGHAGEAASGAAETAPPTPACAADGGAPCSAS